MATLNAAGQRKQTELREHRDLVSVLAGPMQALFTVAAAVSIVVMNRFPVLGMIGTLASSALAISAREARVMADNVTKLTDSEEECVKAGLNEASLTPHFLDTLVEGTWVVGPWFRDALIRRL